MRSTPWFGAIRIALALVVAGSGCGSPAGSADGRSGERTPTRLVVFAAASLTDAFDELGEAFVLASPDREVMFSFAASSELVTQIAEGAPADVFASADQANMAKLVDAGNHGGDPVVFATNRLEIIVAPGNPERIGGVGDLADDGLVVVTCAQEVPCGAYANEVFANAGVEVRPSSFEQNVKAVVSKVTLGEADAGIVYRTDVAAAGGAATGVAIPVDVNVVARYPIAVTADASEPDGARAFVDFVRSDVGQEILSSHGFDRP